MSALLHDAVSTNILAISNSCSWHWVFFTKIHCTLGSNILAVFLKCNHSIISHSIISKEERCCSSCEIVERVCNCSINNPGFRTYRLAFISSTNSPKENYTLDCHLPTHLYNSCLYAVTIIKLLPRQKWPTVREIIMTLFYCQLQWSISVQLDQKPQLGASWNCLVSQKQNTMSWKNFQN